MGKRLVLLLAISIAALMVLPAVALANLVNEYGMHYAGQTTCVGCHGPGTIGGGADAAQVHGEFVTPGLHPDTPADWSLFRSAGNTTPVPGTGNNLWDAGGSYPFTLDWTTLGAFNRNSGTEYLFFQGSDNPTVNPWNLVEGLSWSPTEDWVLRSDDGPGHALYDGEYGCQRCHMLGSTVPQPDATTTAVVPNPAASATITDTTARQWARDSSTTVDDFNSDPTVSAAGFGIQCENCHGTGQTATGAAQHMGTGVAVSTSLATLGNSQVCGQCHGSFTNVAGTLGIYGFTTNTRLADYVDVNGVSGGQSYTKIPTEAEFLADPTAYWMFPNGSNAKGNHYYYDEWAASAHSYRAALAFSSPSPAPSDAMAYQASGKSVYANNFFGEDTVAAGCYKCHTGEGYLQTKGAKIAQNFTPAPDTVGKMGQECVTCHSPHPSAVGAADVIRPADKAGVRSATGLTVDNASICEDCHNWQMEVLGTTPAPAPMDVLGDGDPRHAQRETLHGRSVMMDVADASEFMPGAKCENCHMPKTNKAATRISHGMKPMLPGKAQEWMTAAGASYQGQDSCSGCHSSRTRTELQASITKWQDDAKAEAAKVAAAITVAKKSKEFSATIKAKPGYVLVGRASWNYTAFVQDASGSVHNPPYIMAGLVKAEQLAKSVGGKFTHVGASTSVKRGHLAHVAGQIVNGNGSAAAGATVKLLRGTKVLATTVSDSHGNFAFTLKVVKTYKTYRVRWARSSVAITNLYSPSMTIRVR
jgi:hypothetical protein